MVRLPEPGTLRTKCCPLSLSSIVIVNPGRMHSAGKVIGSYRFERKHAKCWTYSSSHVSSASLKI